MVQTSYNSTPHTKRIATEKVLSASSGTGIGGTSILADLVPLYA